MAESLSEAGEDALLETCWQDAREFVTSSDLIEMEAIRARLKQRLSGLCEEDRARFVERLQARDGGCDEWGLAAKREEMVRVLRHALGVEQKP
jgi:hypothetical protein